MYSLPQTMSRIPILAGYNSKHYFIKQCTIYFISACVFNHYRVLNISLLIIENTNKTIDTKHICLG